jgi:hypothetical protein
VFYDGHGEIQLTIGVRMTLKRSFQYLITMLWLPLAGSANSAAGARAADY